MTYIAKPAPPSGFAQPDVIVGSKRRVWELNKVALGVWLYPDRPAPSFDLPAMKATHERVSDVGIDGVRPQRAEIGVYDRFDCGPEEELPVGWNGRVRMTRLG